MKVYICDLCKQKKADHRFKVKHAKRVWGEDWYTGYERVEVCEKCAEKLFSIPSYETQIKYMTNGYTGQNDSRDEK